MRTWTSVPAAVLAVLLTLWSAPVAQAVAPARAAAHWVATWGTAMSEGSAELASWPSYTVRHFPHTSLGGSAVRIRLSNVYGDGAARFGRVTVAVATATSPRRPVSTPRELSFGGRRPVTVAAGGTAVSDPLPFTVAAGSDLVVSMFLDRPPGLATRHRAAYAHNHLAAGDQSGALDPAVFTRSTTSWYFLADVEVDAPGGAVVAFGDSITDGAGSTVGTDRRWPDRLAARDRRSGVVNAGISGNKVLADNPGYGPAGISRAQRDITRRAGVRTAILLQGINDIRQDNPPSLEQLWQGYRRIVATAHARGIRVLGGTLTPFQGSARFTAARESLRQQVNQRIRSGVLFDGVVDFDAAVRDPADPARLRAHFHNGDWLHPNDAGYQAMAGAVPLSELPAPAVAGTRSGR
ncbi:SGNH/GDSL hydrolase family protein [Crossiella cryophila]|uniref:Lysophospholipase L1-like esterase n=1 Tax=Crossiella cryophila TaxID=43355 RepID=A0A7W7CDI0_9PSEU|nr:SGNH/GDSL hydrolase family protein [Crossiella cryophila]MBB4679037.1 lysophospholipase L1-like esterase [Crossiella cryophila]